MQLLIRRHLEWCRDGVEPARLHERQRDDEVHQIVRLLALLAGRPVGVAGLDGVGTAARQDGGEESRLARLLFRASIPKRRRSRPPSSRAAGPGKSSIFKAIKHESLSLAGSGNRRCSRPLRIDASWTASLLQGRTRCARRGRLSQDRRHGGHRPTPTDRGCYQVGRATGSARSCSHAKPYRR